MASKHVASRELLDHIARRLLVRLFEPHAAFFAEHGLAIAELATTIQNDRRLVHRAYDILRDHVAAAPSDLCAILAAIEALSNLSGQGAIYKVCPALSELRLEPKDAAATAALDYPEAFARVKRGTEPAPQSTTDYDAVSDRAPLLGDEAFAALKDGLVLWLVTHGRTAKCELHVRNRDGEVRSRKRAHVRRRLHAEPARLRDHRRRGERSRAGDDFSRRARSSDRARAADRESARCARRA